MSRTIYEKLDRWALQDRLDDQARRLIEVDPRSDRELAEAAGLHQVTVTRWRLGKREMSPESLGRLIEAMQALPAWARELDLAKLAAGTGLTDAELARAIGVERQHIHQWRTGEHRPTWKTMQRIYHAIAAHIHQLSQ